MESEHSSHWKGASQGPGRPDEPGQSEELERPDERGLCWRQTEIGLLAFKTNEDGSKIGLHFDSDGNGTQVIFDEAGQAFYVDGDITLPVPPPKPHQLPEEHEPPQIHKPAFASQETFGRGTAVSQMELLLESCTGNEVHTSSDFKQPDRQHASLGGSKGATIQRKNTPETETRRKNTTELEGFAHPQTSRNYAELEFLGSPTFPSIERGDSELSGKGACFQLKRALSALNCYFFYSEQAFILRGPHCWAKPGRWS